MYIRLKDLLLQQPFERIMEIATQEGIAIHYDANLHEYQCKFWVKNTEYSTSSSNKITHAVIDAVLSKLVAEDQ